MKVKSYEVPLRSLYMYIKLSIKLFPFMLDHVPNLKKESQFLAGWHYNWKTECQARTVMLRCYLGMVYA